MDCRDTEDASVLLLLSPFCGCPKLTGGALDLVTFFSPVNSSLLKSSTSYWGLAGAVFLIDGF